MRKLRAGLYETTIDGIRVTVENTTSAYGDSGWFYFVSDGRQEDRSDMPYDTKRDALESARAALATGYSWLRRS